MTQKKLTKSINFEETSLGIELGSTRIKAVLIDNQYNTIASGEFEWENQFIDGIWTYDLDDVWVGLQQAYKNLAENVEQTYGTNIKRVGSLGISGMMHGYMPFDKEGNLLSRFKTWRNSDTDKAVEELSELFQFNIPHRWSIAHLYQAILNNETHVKNIARITTLSSYIHWCITNQFVIGIGEASGMFPINNETLNYDKNMQKQFKELIKNKDYEWEIEEILPKVLTAGEKAGVLTVEGAKLLDPSGNLEAGIPIAPPEGDAGTGMVATNSVRPHTGNISAGTSIFSMTVLEGNLSNYYKEVDMVTTPSGVPTAMIHCNNFTTSINELTALFSEAIHSAGKEIDNDQLFSILFKKALEADDDAGQLMSFNYFAGEPITNTTEGRPLFVRTPDSNLTLGNVMYTEINSALATLKIGTDILTVQENVSVDFMIGHGGFFKTAHVGQQMMANALNIPISVMETASQGGPWGMAVLASYLVKKNKDQTLEEYLDDEVFSNIKVTKLNPEIEGVKQYKKFLNRYKQALQVEKAAIKHIE